MPDPSLVDRGLERLKMEKESLAQDYERFFSILMSNRRIREMIGQYAASLRIGDAIVASVVVGYFLRDKVSMLEMERIVNRAGGSMNLQ